MSRSTKKRRKFTVNAPEASSVFLVGSFDNWDEARRPLWQSGAGTWECTVTLPAGTHEYLYLVDGQWQEDPSCQECCENAFGTRNSVAHV